MEIEFQMTDLKDSEIGLVTGQLAEGIMDLEKH